MSVVDSILVPVDGSATAARCFGGVMWLAGRLNAEVHVLSAGDPAVGVRDELRRLQVPERYWSDVDLHLSDRPPEQAVLEAVVDYGIDLIVMSARGAAADAADDDPLAELGHVTRWIVQRSDVPVLVLPPCYEERLPWTTALVPVSGEPGTDEVLGLALRLGCALGFCATAVHVLGGAGQAGLGAEAHYADAPYHEYPERLQALVARGLPGCTAEEAGCLTDVVLAHGDVAEQLLTLVAERHVDLLVIGWHGSFLAGHAGVVRALLRRATCPILLAKPPPPAPFRLKVGEELE